VVTPGPSGGFQRDGPAPAEGGIPVDSASGGGYLRAVARLDTPGGRGYKPALFFAAALLVAGEVWAKDLVVKGAVLPGGAREIGENRYRSPLNWFDTLDFYRRTYKWGPRSDKCKTLIAQPGIKACHIDNESGEGEWEGLNVYELEGETRIFIVLKDRLRPGPGKGEKPADKEKK
jgi:hypothetical protein